jgi:hypothetical protein
VYYQFHHTRIHFGIHYLTVANPEKEFIVFDSNFLSQMVLSRLLAPN